ncbi:ABC transporter substrate-binding protein [Rhodobacter sp. NSM]|uniref:ABC transporter substrate-binding protein n=1 Tax=Rhodobacter sp. NSM TaxID=3457501 RepID=UPI003FD1DC62
MARPEDAGGCQGSRQGLGTGLTRRALLASAGALVAARPLGAAAADLSFRHVWGEFTLPAPARRVVSLGASTQDPLLALGVVPVAIRSWFGDFPYGVWPWAQQHLGDATPVLLGGEVSAERIASLEPDLIVGIGSGLSQEEHAILSRVAPVLMQDAGVSTWGMAWDSVARRIGRAVGREAEAARLVEGVTGEFAGFRARHPSWVGRTAVAAWQDSGQTGAFTGEDTRSRFLSDLGFRPPEALLALPALDGFYTTLSSEDFDPIDADLLVWISDLGRAADIARLPMRRTMRAWHEGREIFSDFLTTGAMSFGTVLSLPFALHRMEPEMILALDGDPATTVPSAVEAGLAP